MKKSTKIFAIVLTLALVLGVITVGAAAFDSTVGNNYVEDKAEAIPGEYITWAANFDNVSPINYPAANVTDGEKYIATNIGTNSLGVIYKGRQGEVSVVGATKGAQNNYVQITMSESSAEKVGGNPYLTLGTGNAQNISKPGVSLAEAKYTVIDYDVFFPDLAGRPTSRPSMGVELRYYNASGARDFIHNGGYELQTLGFSYQTNDKGNATEIYHQRGGWNGRIDLPSDQWAHITYIVESQINDNGTPADSSDDYLDLTEYTCVDGKIYWVYTCSAHPSDPSKFKDGDMTAIYIMEYRFGWGSSVAGNVTGFDNIAYRYYTDEYEGNLADVLAEGKGADLTKWDRNAYDPAKMPMGKNAGAKIGETEYVNLAAAVKAAEAGATIEVLADSTTAITVDKALTFNLNGKTVTGLATADGFSKSEEDGVITISKATTYLEVVWYGCECEEGCIEEVTTKVYLGNNIYDSYRLAMGKNPVCAGTVDGLTYTKHAGFEDLAGVLESFDETTVVTEDMLGESIELAPIYYEDTAIAVRIDALGNESYIFASQGLTTTACSFANGITIQLLNNVNIDAALWCGAKDVTIDLNGYRLAYVKEGAGTDRKNTFQVAADNFTITSTRVGGAIYNATKTSATTYQGMPVISADKHDTTINLIGQYDGVTTMSIYAAMVYQSYGARANLNIDGGNYMGAGAADGYGLFYAKVCGSNYNIENAYFDGGNAVFSFGGATNTASKTEVNITNCVFGTSSVASKTTFATLKVTFDGCYIGGNVNQSGEVISGATAPENKNATHIIKNSFIKSGAIVNAVYAEGQTAYGINMTKEFIFNRNNYKTGTFGSEESLAVTAVPVSMTFDRMIADAKLEPVNTEWYAADGETLLGTSTAMPGSEATAPSFGDVEGTNGMVVETYKDWNENTYIPLGTTGTVKFTLKEGAEKVLGAGKVGVMFNFDMINHFQYNHYVPEAPEGVTYVKVVASGAEVPFGNWRFPNNFAFTDPKTGTKYTCVNSWPNMDGVDAEFGFQVVYTYAGQEFTYTAPSISIPKYVNYVLGAEQYANMPEFKTAMADLVRAIKATKEAAGKGVASTLVAACENAAPYMSVAEEVIDKTKLNDTSAIDAYIESISYDAYGYSVAPNVSVRVKEGYAAVFTANRIYGANAIGDTRNNGNAYYAHNIRTYALSEAITISIYNADDVTKASNGVITANKDAVPVGVVSVTSDGFINADTDADAKTSAFYLAFHAYSKSAAAYMEWRHIWVGGAPKYN